MIGLTCRGYLPNPVQPRSNPAGLRFSGRRFFGTSTYLSFFQPLWESRKVEHKQKGNDGGRKPAPGYQFLRKAPEFLGFTLCNRPALAVSSQPFGVIGGRQGLLPPGAADRRPIVALVYSMIPLVSRFDLLHRRLILRFEFAVQLEVLIESTGAWHWSRGLRSVVEEISGAGPVRS